MDKISRKSLLYKTKVEYGDFTINHVQGCAHGCKYPCYAYLIAKRFGKIKTYEEWVKPKLVDNYEELIENEIPKLKSKINLVNLSFTTDPFMQGYEEIQEASIKIIRKLNESGIKCVILTKGILPLSIKNLSKDNEYGITLVSLDESFREKYEPNASNLHDRIEALKKLHFSGCKTWVSIEPYPTPNIINQSLIEILNRVSFVDKIVFGRLNYNKVVSEYDNYKHFYNESSKVVEKFCSEKNIACHIKTGTKREESK